MWWTVKYGKFLRLLFFNGNLTFSEHLAVAAPLTFNLQIFKVRFYKIPPQFPLILIWPVISTQLDPKPGQVHTVLRDTVTQRKKELCRIYRSLCPQCFFSLSFSSLYLYLSQPLSSLWLLLISEVRRSGSFPLALLLNHAKQLQTSESFTGGRCFQCMCVWKSVFTWEKHVKNAATFQEERKIWIWWKRRVWVRDSECCQHISWKESALFTYFSVTPGLSKIFIWYPSVRKKYSPEDEVHLDFCALLTQLSLFFFHYFWV